MPCRQAHARKDCTAPGAPDPSKPTDSTAATSAAPPSWAASVRHAVGLCIYRYNLSTALYMLEPWERALFNAIVCAVVAYTAYGLYYRAIHPLFERFAATYI